MYSKQIPSYLDDIRTRIERGLKCIIDPASAGPMYDALRYSIEGKGKRIRPVLCVLAGTMFDADEEKLLDAALAMEVFHTFTLVHDDIMDHSGLRRGRETVHIKWDVSTAILVGDFLLGLTYDLLTRSEPSNITKILKIQGETVRILCKGQAMDMQFEYQTDISVEDYLAMIDQKTGRLLSLSLESGALFGQISEQNLQQLSFLGRDMGRAFQIQDDLLDLTASDSSWGKDIGGDLLSGKKTFLLAGAIERSSGDEQKWWLDVVAQGRLSKDGVSVARQRLENLGVLEAARSAVISYSQSARDIVSELPDSEARAALAALMESLKERRF